MIFYAKVMIFTKYQFVLIYTNGPKVVRLCKLIYRDRLNMSASVNAVVFTKVGDGRHNTILAQFPVLLQFVNGFVDPLHYVQ